MITLPLSHPDRLFIGGAWVAPSTDSSFDVVEAATEELIHRVAEAREADMSRAIASAREAFDHGPWPRLTHTQRAEVLRAVAAGTRDRLARFAEIWTRQSGVVHGMAQFALADAPEVVER